MNSSVNITWEWTDLTSDADRREAALALLDASQKEDGIEPLSEQFVLGLSDSRLEHHHLLGTTPAGEIVAVAAVTGSEAEFSVAPAHRRQGIGTAIYKELASNIDGLQTWAHGNTPGAQAIAASQGLQQVRRLLVLDIEGDALAKGAHFEVPDHTTALTLRDSRERWPNIDVEGAWLQANNEAFSWHPEQGGWSRERLQRAMEVAWFSPDDVWFLWDTSAAEPALIGFHWTKRHDEAIWEVYVVGLADAYRGQRLGGPLVAMGLHHMHAQGAQRVLLYVEDDNKAAVERYRQDGFSLAEEHVVYAAR